MKKYNSPRIDSFDVRPIGSLCGTSPDPDYENQMGSGHDGAPARNIYM